MDPNIVLVQKHSIHFLAIPGNFLKMGGAIYTTKKVGGNVKKSKKHLRQPFLPFQILLNSLDLLISNQICQVGVGGITSKQFHLIISTIVSARLEVKDKSE